jgi:hypothetical protein
MDNIKMDVGEIGLGGVNWIGLAQNWDQWRDLVNVIMNLWVPENAWKLMSGSTAGFFSRRAHLHGVH